MSLKNLQMTDVTQRLIKARTRHKRHMFQSAVTVVCLLATSIQQHSLHIYGGSFSSDYLILSKNFKPL
jgi:hypothetical protein